MRLELAVRLAASATAWLLRQYFSDMRHAPFGSTSATCDMRLSAALQLYTATCDMRLSAALQRHAVHCDMRLPAAQRQQRLSCGHSLQQQFHLERAMWFCVLSLLFLSCVWRLVCIISLLLRMVSLCSLIAVSSCFCSLCSCRPVSSVAHVLLFCYSILPLFLLSLCTR